MSFLKRRRADSIYREGGWGPLLTWSAPRADGSPLVFQTRLPLNVELIYLDALVDSAPGAPEFLSDARRTLERGAQAAGTIVAGALYGTGNGVREMLGTMTVSLADGLGPPEITEGAETDGDTRTHTQVTKLSDQATEVKRLIAVTLPDRSEPVPMLMMQYLMETRYGALSVAFTTANTDMFGDFGRSMFLKITKTGFLGERPRPY